MVKEIITVDHPNTKVLVTKCDQPTTSEIVRDILDTAEAHKTGCAGLAANQIGHLAPVIVVKIQGEFVPMIEPEVVGVSGGRVSGAEMCLSVPGKVRPIRRHKKITLKYRTEVDGEFINREFRKWTARVIQHELDHLEGKLIYTPEALK